MRRSRKPAWLKARPPAGERFTEIKSTLREYDHEVYQTIGELRAVGVDIVAFDQYLRPSTSHLDISEYVHPDEFDVWKQVAEAEFDFLYAASGPMVRSSFRAGELFVESLLREERTVTDARAVADRA